MYLEPTTGKGKTLIHRWKITARETTEAHSTPHRVPSAISYPPNLPKLLPLPEHTSPALFWTCPSARCPPGSVSHAVPQAWNTPATANTTLALEPLFKASLSPKGLSYHLPRSAIPSPAPHSSSSSTLGSTERSTRVGAAHSRVEEPVSPGNPEGVLGELSTKGRHQPRRGLALRAAAAV